MKTYATFGLVGALLGALQMLALFFFGLHGERIDLLNDWKVSLPLGLLGFAVSVAVVVLGIRAWREATPDNAMGYGRGLGGGVLIGLWQGLGSAVFMLLYGLVINPGFKEAMVANQMAQLRLKGVPAEAYPMMEKMMNFTLNPFAQAAGAFFFSVVVATVVALIAAAVLKREPRVESGKLPATPPALG